MRAGSGRRGARASRGRGGGGGGEGGVAGQAAGPVDGEGQGRPVRVAAGWGAAGLAWRRAYTTPWWLCKNVVRQRDPPSHQHLPADGTQRQCRPATSATPLS